MDLAVSIKTAWAAVVESGVPEHMQELAFREALRTLLGTARPEVAQQIARPAVRRNDAEQVGGDDIDNTATADENAVIDTLTEHTGVSREKLEKIFHLDAGVVKLLVNNNALGNSTADKTRTAAQIITVVRKVGMGHADTSFEVIRVECERKHFYDSKNFASKHLPSIPGFAVKGEGRGKRLEARPGGVSAFPTLIDKVLGES